MDIMESLVSSCQTALVWSGRRCRIRSGFRRAGSGAVRHFLAGGIPVSAALYESWSVPFSVMLVVPLGLSARCWQPGCAGWKTMFTSSGPVNGHWFIGEKRHPDRRVANEMNQKGHDLFEATLHACRSVYARF